MDIISFIKDLLISSLSGISLKNLPFIVLQLSASWISLFIVFRLLKFELDLKSSLYTLLFTAMIIVAGTSVPLAILAAAILFSYLFSRRELGFEENLIILTLAFLCASGHLILLLLAIVIVFIISFFIKRK